MRRRDCFDGLFADQSYVSGRRNQRGGRAGRGDRDGFQVSRGADDTRRTDQQQRRAGPQLPDSSRASRSRSSACRGALHLFS